MSVNHSAIELAFDGLGGAPSARKAFSKVAVDHLGQCVRPAELYALLGPNGAGKTTTLRMVGSFWWFLAHDLPLSWRHFRGFRNLSGWMWPFSSLAPSPSFTSLPGRLPTGARLAAIGADDVIGAGVGHCNRGPQLVAIFLLPVVNMNVLLGRSHWLSAYPTLLGCGLLSTSVGLMIAVTLYARFGPRRTRTVAQVVSTVIGAVFAVGVQVINILPDGISASRATLPFVWSGTLLALQGMAVAAPVATIIGAPRIWLAAYSFDSAVVTLCSAPREQPARR